MNFIIFIGGFILGCIANLLAANTKEYTTKLRLGRALAAIGMLHDAAEQVIAEGNPMEHIASCHCGVCVTHHAFSATEGIR